MKWLQTIWIRIKRKRQLAPKEQVVFFLLHELMLCDFIAIVCDKLLHKVVKSGKPTQAQVAEAWDKLFIRYCDILGDADYESAIDSEKELSTLAAKINMVTAVLQPLMKVFVKDIAEMLAEEYGFIIEYFEDEATYLKQFVTLEAKLKRWQVDFDIMLLERPKENGYEPVTRETFSRIRIELGEFMGYAIQEHNTTAEDFALMIRKLSSHNRMLEARNKKNAA